MPDLQVHAVTVNLTVSLTAEEVAGLALGDRMAELLQLRPAVEAPRNGKTPRALPAAVRADAKGRPTHCLLKGCGKKLKQSGMGRAKRFCDATCARLAREGADGGDDEEHGAPAATKPAAKAPAPNLTVAPARRLVLPELPPQRRPPAAEELPPRTPQDLPTERGYDPTKQVVELRGGGGPSGLRRVGKDVSALEQHAAVPPRAGAGGSVLLRRLGEQRRRAMP